jgi:replicative DNA helicase
MPEQRVQPHDLIAEQSVLGGMMLSKSAVWDCLATVEGPDFYTPKHQTMFEAISSVAGRDEPVDALTVIDELTKSGSLASAGGPEYVHEVTGVPPTAANAGYYANMVREFAIKRRMIEAGERITAWGFASAGDAQEQLEAGRTELDRIVRASTTDVRSVGASFNRVVDAIGSRPDATPTPWASLDEILVGLMPGKLYVVGARPGDGKTIMGLQFARALAVRGNVAFSSLEMAEDELTQRLIASMATVDLGALTRHMLTEAEWEKVATVRPRIERMPLFVDDRSGVTITQIKSFARSVARKGHIGGVVVDYLQLVSGTSNDQKRFEIVSEVSRQLKIMARELECPVLALSQLNRESAGSGKLRQRPTLAHLRESGSIEQDADVVMLLQRSEEKDGLPGDRLDVHVAKNRSGRVTTRPLLWEGKYARISPFTTAVRFDPPVPD